MRICIYAVGKVREKALNELLSRYLKMASRYVQLEIREFPDYPDQDSADLACKREGEVLLKALEKEGRVLALDLHGERLDSEQFSAQLMAELELGGARLALVIAGSNGFSPELRARMDRRWSLGALTYPHQLVRLLAVEQIYRAFKIARGETYHK